MKGTLVVMGLVEQNGVDERVVDDTLLPVRVRTVARLSDNR